MRRFLLSLCVLASCMLVSAQGFMMPERVVSPEFGPQTVTFRLKAPSAQSVLLSCSWLSMMDMKQMTKNEKGIWEVTLPKPAPDLYQYYFIVDGVTIADPSDFNSVRDGSSYRSFVPVRGDDPLPYEYSSSTRHGKLEKVWYPSSVYGFQRRVSVYLPYGYETSGRYYPVFYLQHGGGGDEEAWPTLGRACEIMDYMIERGLCEPMIVVMPNCNPSVAAAHEVALPETNPENMADPDFMEGLSHVESLYTDLIPFIENTYRARTGKSERAVAGLSMGGIYTLNLTQKRPDLFDYIGVLSMGTTQDKNAVDQLLPVKQAGYKLYYVGCGETDIAWPGAEKLLSGLKELGMDHVYFGDVPGHQWETWRKCLLDLAPRLFR